MPHVIYLTWTISTKGNSRMTLCQFCIYYTINTDFQTWSLRGKNPWLHLVEVKILLLRDDDCSKVRRNLSFLCISTKLFPSILSLPNDQSKSRQGDAIGMLWERWGVWVGNFPLSGQTTFKMPCHKPVLCWSAFPHLSSPLPNSHATMHTILLPICRHPPIPSP